MLPKVVVAKAIEVAQLSPCKKSRRGVVIWHPRGEIVAMGNNHPPRIELAPEMSLPAVLQRQRRPAMRGCDGSEACRASCSKRCIHAESAAIRGMVFGVAQVVHGKKITPAQQRALIGEFELVHVKVGADGDLVAGGAPSCWQCSREILDVGLGAVWLYLTAEAASEPAPTWMRFSALDFDEATRQACGVY